MGNMKLIVLVLFSVIFVSHQTELLSRVVQVYYNHTIQYLDQCLTETGTSKKMFDQFENFGDVIADQHFRCFLHCMTLAAGVFNEEGEVFAEKLIQLLEISNQELIKDINAKCKFTKSIDKCYAAQDFVLCVADSLALYKY